MQYSKHLSTNNLIHFQHNLTVTNYYNLTSQIWQFMIHAKPIIEATPTRTESLEVNAARMCSHKSFPSNQIKSSLQDIYLMISVRSLNPHLDAIV